MKVCVIDDDGDQRTVTTGFFRGLWYRTIDFSLFVIGVTALCIRLPAVLRWYVHDKLFGTNVQAEIFAGLDKFVDMLVWLSGRKTRIDRIPSARIQLALTDGAPERGEGPAWFDEELALLGMFDDDA